MKLKLSRKDKSVGYVYLSNHPGAGTAGASSKNVHLSDLIKDYKGADIIFDFNEENEIIGIEIIE
ncbi:MAG: DUF2283 domain-containing protein [bacterium]|nr:DUF2283 domain-containing protein [bacterium]